MAKMFKSTLHHYKTKERTTLVWSGEKVTKNYKIVEQDKYEDSWSWLICLAGSIGVTSQPSIADGWTNTDHGQLSKCSGQCQQNYSLSYLVLQMLNLMLRDMP